MHITNSVIYRCICIQWFPSAWDSASAARIPVLAHNVLLL